MGCFDCRRISSSVLLVFAASGMMVEGRLDGFSME